MIATLPASLLLAALSAEPSPAGAAAEVNPYLAQARSLYQRLEPQACLYQLDRASRWKSTPSECVDIELLAGLCSFFSGNELAASDRFELALRLNPGAQLPPNTSPKIGEVFERIRQRLVKEARPAPAPAPAVATAAAPAPAAAAPAAPAEALPPTVTKPFGGESGPASSEGERRSYWGPISLGGAAVLATAAGVILGARAKQLERQHNSANTPSGAADQAHASAISNAQAANWAFAVAAGSAVAGTAWLVFRF